MRPQITFPKDLKRALNYHEKKVQKGTAELLHAYSFFKPMQELNIYDKLERFGTLMALNERAETKLIHIPLNFHPSEKGRLTKELFIQLADEYMERIGFGNQPYLVYRHEDAAHPHVHILSPLIKDDGKRIPTHYIARDISEPVRKEMERTYGFIPADKKEKTPQPERKLTFHAHRIKYGKSETIRGITNILEAVIDHYKYASLPELNAVLGQFNVMADRGQEKSRIYKKRGLTYRILDEHGQKMGVPIKASSIYFKPTLNYLEIKFQENKLKREPDKRFLKIAIDWAMHKHAGSMDKLVKLLEEEKINVVLRRSERGRIYGITYVDHARKTVFNGSDLGKEYSAKRIQERLGLKLIKELNPAGTRTREPNKNRKYQRPANWMLATYEPNTHPHGTVLQRSTKLLEQILEPENNPEVLAYELREEQKRKKKRRLERQQEF